MVGHVKEEHLGMGLVAKLEEDPGGTNHFVTAELSERRSTRDGLGYRTRRRIVAQLVRSELPIEGGHVIGPRGVPLRGELGFALRFGCAAPPIRGTRLGVGRADPRQDAGEVLESQGRLLHVAQCNIAQEELGVGKRVSFDQAMLLDNSISEFGFAAGENPAGNRLPFRPPCRRADEVSSLGEQNLDRSIGHVLFAPPAQLLEDEPRIGAQLRRNPRDRRLGIGGLRGKRQARLSQQTVVGRQDAQHPVGRLALALPQQSVDPLNMILGAQRGGMASEKILLDERAVIRGDPGGSQGGGAAFEIPRIEHHLCFTDLACRADRGIALEPFGSDRIRFAGQSLLGMFAQAFLRRPLGVSLDELGNLGKATGGAGASVVHPAQHLQRYRIGYRGGTGVSAAPIAGLRSGECGAHHLRIGRRQGLSRRRRAVDCENGQNYREQPAEGRHQDRPLLC